MKVVIHVHPRTASTSLLRYLRDNPPDGDTNLLHHAHYLNDRRHKWFAKGAYKDIVGHQGKDQWKVITIVRDPVAINLSVFWAWHSRHVQHDGMYFFEETKNFYMDTIDHQSPIHHMSSEIEAFWNFNVFEGDSIFGPWRIINDRLLILNFNYIDTWTHAIDVFLGIPEGEFPHLNKGSKSLDLKFSDAYLRGLYRSRHVEKFFTEDEVNQFVEKYGGKPFKRVRGEKHVTVLKGGFGEGFQPVRIIHDESELPEDGTEIRAKVGIFGPHGKRPDEIEP